MDQLAFYQYVLIGCVFVWSGFVRSGLGFGGAVLALPFLLLIVNDPLVFLPLIAVHLLFFSSLIMWQSHHAQRQNTTGPSIDWGLPQTRYDHHYRAQVGWCDWSPHVARAMDERDHLRDRIWLRTGLSSQPANTHPK